MHLSVFVTALLALYLVNADGTADPSSDSGDVTRSGNDETDGYNSRLVASYYFSLEGQIIMIIAREKVFSCSQPMG